MIRIVLLGVVLAAVWWFWRRMNNRQGAASTPPTTEGSLSRPEAADPVGEPTASTVDHGGAVPEAEPRSAEPPVAEPLIAEPFVAEPAVVEAGEVAACPLCGVLIAVSAEDGCGRPDCPIPALAEAFNEQLRMEADAASGAGGGSGPLRGGGAG